MSPRKRVATILAFVLVIAIAAVCGIWYSRNKNEAKRQELLRMGESIESAVMALDLANENYASLIEIQEDYDDLNERYQSFLASKDQYTLPEFLEKQNEFLDELDLIDQRIDELQKQ